MDVGCRKVEVLMSTYNGMMYIERQITSILNQKGVDVHITIRDDGSTDQTVDALQRCADLFPCKIKIVVGENIGYKRSFLTLLSYAEEADYYAFSDQDDIWTEAKLRSAMDFMQDKSKVLYVSNLTICNTDLEVLSKTNISSQYSSIYSEFTRHRYAGCTYVFDKELKQMVARFSNLSLPKEQMPSHDALIARCAYACGEVVIDENSYIYHIRYNHSVTIKNNSILERMKREWCDLMRPSMSLTTAKVILDNIPEYVTENNAIFLRQIVTYRQSLRSWLSLLFNSNMTSGILLCDLLCKLKILMRKY